MATIVYQFGLRAHTVLPAEVVDQIRLAHHLRDALVTAEHDQDTAMLAVWSALTSVVRPPPSATP